MTMSPEELKMILDTVKSVADTAGVAGITWICIHYATIAISHIAVPFAWAGGLIMVARYGSKWLTESDRRKGEIKQLASADEVEKTKRAVIGLEQAKEELEKAKVSAASSEATMQLKAIALAAGVPPPAYGGLYSKELNAVLGRLKK
jgi:hypothetical protein